MGGAPAPQLGWGGGEKTFLHSPTIWQLSRAHKVPLGYVEGTGRCACAWMGTLFGGRSNG